MDPKAPYGYRTEQERWQDEAGDTERDTLESLTEELLGAKRELCSAVMAVVVGDDSDEVDGAFLPVAKYLTDNAFALRLTAEEQADLKSAVVEYRRICCSGVP